MPAAAKHAESVTCARTHMAERKSGHLGDAVHRQFCRHLGPRAHGNGRVAEHDRAGTAGAVFDGLMLPQDRCEGAMDHALLRELDTAAETATGWTARLARKLMHDAIDIAPPLTGAKGAKAVEVKCDKSGRTEPNAQPVQPSAAH